MNSRFKCPENSPGFMLWKLTMQWQKQLKKALQPLELTQVQFVVLACLQWLLSEGEKGIKQSQISQVSQLDKMVVSETAQKLLTKNLIVRRPHQTDTRSYELDLSEAGALLISKALPIVEDVDAQFFLEKREMTEAFAQVALSKL